MIKLARKAEAEDLKHLPAEVVALAVELATILDEYYGDKRTKFKI